MQIKTTVYYYTPISMAKIWKQPRCLLVGKKLSKLQYIQTMDIQHEKK